ncbi:hypothetical protein ABIE44_003544 [Marmoricola sp. OAE513]|uniref:hypothetical protein n=1 Tax=Marmoricola sp. OAE513 TaxID=2817894 RepID=UPI001AE1FE81
MSFVGPFLVAVVVLAAVISLAVSVVRSLRTPIVNVADELVVSAPAVEVESAVVELLGLARKVELEMVLPGTYQLSYRYSSGAMLFLALVTFPIGLLLLAFGATRMKLTVSVVADAESTRIRVFGRVHQPLAVAIGEALETRFRQVPVRR